MTTVAASTRIPAMVLVLSPGANGWSAGVRAAPGALAEDPRGGSAGLFLQGDEGHRSPDDRWAAMTAKKSAPADREQGDEHGGRPAAEACATAECGAEAGRTGRCGRSGGERRSAARVADGLRRRALKA